MSGWTSTWRFGRALVRLSSLDLSESTRAGRALQAAGFTITEDQRTDAKREELAQTLIQCVQKFKHIAMLSGPETAVHRIAEKAAKDLGFLVTVPKQTGVHDESK